MRIAANYCHAWQGEGFLRSYNMYDAVVFRAHSEMPDAELCTVGGKCLYLLASYRVVYMVLLVGRGVMVGHSDDMVRTEHLDLLVAQGIEGLR